MATAPQRPAAPPPPLKTRADDHPPPAVGGGHLARTGEERPTIGVKGEPIEDGSRDPGTIAEEQRRRGAEIEKVGVEAWKAARDERSLEHAQLEGAKHENHKSP